jgi:hypothetical protein
LNGLQAEGELAGGLPVAGPELCAGLRAELALFVFESLHLADQSFTHGRMRGQAFVVLADLFAQVFFLHLQERFRIGAFETADGEAEEAANEVAETFKHRGKSYGIERPDCAAAQSIGRNSPATPAARWQNPSFGRRPIRE